MATQSIYAHVQLGPLFPAFIVLRPTAGGAILRIRSPHSKETASIVLTKADLEELSTRLDGYLMNLERPEDLFESMSIGKCPAAPSICYTGD